MEARTRPKPPLPTFAGQQGIGRLLELLQLFVSPCIAVGRRRTVL